MKKLVVLGAVAVALMLSPMMVAAQDDAAKDVELKGEPVDIVCYLQGRAGEGHATCAKSCAEKGQPIGLVVDQDGEKQLYLVVGSGGKAAKDLMAEHMGKQVNVKGKASKKDGMMVIAVSEVAA